MLIEQRQIAFDVAARDDIGVGERLLQRRQSHLLAKTLLEHQRGHALGSEQLLVAGSRELAFVLEGRQCAYELRELSIGDTEIVTPRLAFEQSLADDLLQNRIADFRAVEHRGIEVCAHGLAHPILLLADRFGVFRLCDSVPSHLGDFADGARAAEIVVDAEEREGKGNQRQNYLNDAFFAVYEIEHDAGSLEKDD